MWLGASSKVLYHVFHQQLNMGARASAEVVKHRAELSQMGTLSSSAQPCTFC